MEAIIVLASPVLIMALAGVVGMASDDAKEKRKARRNSLSPYIHDVWTLRVARATKTRRN